MSCQECLKIARAGVLSLCLLTFLSGAFLGCGHMEFSTPYNKQLLVAVSDMKDSREPYAVPGKSPAQVRMERLAQTLAEWQAKAGEAADYLIGPGDVLEVSVLALEAPGRTTALKRVVSQEGLITLPWVGRMQASGLSAKQLEENIKGSYSEKYLKDPQVTVGVAEYRSNAVVVTGAVGKPGIYYLTANESTVLAVLAQAGGLRAEAGDELLITRVRESRGENPGSGKKANSSNSSSDYAPLKVVSEEDPLEIEPADPQKEPAENNWKVIPLDLKELIDKGNLLVNLEVKSGDIITVPQRSTQYVCVLGYVRSPKAFELKDGVRLDALKAVAMAGGLTAASRAENSFLIRQTAEGQKVIPVDLTKVTRGVRPPLYMEPGDTLVIGTSFLGRIREFVDISIGGAISGGTVAP